MFALRAPLVTALWASTRGRRVVRPRVAPPAVAELTAADLDAALEKASQRTDAALEKASQTTKAALEKAAQTTKADLDAALVPIQASLYRLEAKLECLVAFSRSQQVAARARGIATRFGEYFAQPANVLSVEDGVALSLERRLGVYTSVVRVSKAVGGELPAKRRRAAKRKESAGRV